MADQILWRLPLLSGDLLGEETTGEMARRYLAQLGMPFPARLAGVAAAGLEDTAGGQHGG